MLYIKLDIMLPTASPITLAVEMPRGRETDPTPRLTVHNTGYLPVNIRGQYLPPFKQASFPVARGHAQRLYRLVTQARITPFHQPAIVGLDGTTYTLEIQEGDMAARYHWWSKTPPGWEPLGDIATLLTDDIARLEQLNADGEPMDRKTRT